MRATQKQLGGATGKGFRPGQSGNPGGRPAGERTVLRGLYGDDGARLFEHLDRLLRSPKTAAKLRAEIAMFLIERLYGRAPQSVEVSAGASTLEAIVAASHREPAR